MGFFYFLKKKKFYLHFTISILLTIFLIWIVLKSLNILTHHGEILIVPDFNFLHNWCTIHSVTYRDNMELIEKAVIIERIQREVDKYNLELDHISQVKSFRLVCENWTPETGELSPTLKLKRKVVFKRYEDKVNSIYQS
mgnify:CR=1 FL=1